MTKESILSQKEIILGISGSIAAYKTPELIRLMKAQGANVQPVLTRGGAEFVTPLTLQAVAHKPVLQHLLDPASESAMSHIDLARQADAIVIAPASAQIIAELAHGFANELLSALCLVTRAPILIAPAMNKNMWMHPATQDNIALLKSRGVLVIDPDSGEQACGDVGEGRLVDLHEIIFALEKLFSPQLFSQKKILITAGATKEFLDPVRFISNGSSGKMAYALARAAAAFGATVELISTVNLFAPREINVTTVKTAEEMYAAVINQIQNADIFIGVAAVADYRFAEKSQEKKPKQDSMNFSCVPNPDIIAEVARQFPQVFTVGFAAETHEVLEKAKAKRERKNLNLIIANQVGDNLVMNMDEANVIGISAAGEKIFPLMPKKELAFELMRWIRQEYIKN